MSPIAEERPLSGSLDEKRESNADGIDVRAKQSLLDKSPTEEASESEVEEPSEEEQQHWEAVDRNLEAELEAAMAELANSMQILSKGSGKKGEQAFDELTGELRTRMANIAPRFKTLEARGRAVRAGVKARKRR